MVWLVRQIPTSIFVDNLTLFGQTLHNTIRMFFTNHQTWLGHKDIYNHMYSWIPCFYKSFSIKIWLHTLPLFLSVQNSTSSIPASQFTFCKSSWEFLVLIATCIRWQRRKATKKCLPFTTAEFLQTNVSVTTAFPLQTSFLRCL